MDQYGLGLGTLKAWLIVALTGSNNFSQALMNLNNILSFTIFFLLNSDKRLKSEFVGNNGKQILSEVNHRSR